MGVGVVVQQMLLRAWCKKVVKHLKQMKLNYVGEKYMQYSFIRYVPVAYGDFYVKAEMTQKKKTGPD